MSCNMLGEWVSGNVFIRPSRMLAKGEIVQGHKHNFDHTTIVFSGAVRIKGTLPDGTVIEREFRSPRPDWAGPSHALIKAEVGHEITALEDGTIFWCVYSHRDPQGEVWQNYTGWEPAYG